NRDVDKVYNLNKAFQLQRPERRKKEEDAQEILDFDEDAWQEEQEKRRREKQKKYRDSLSCILAHGVEKGRISLKELQEITGEEEQAQLIPNVEVFKEIMVELIRNREIDILHLKKERSAYIQDRPEEFQLGDMLLQLVEENPGMERIIRVETVRLPEEDTVVFEHVRDENGNEKSIRCSNVQIQIIQEARG
ncbi:MAG TPA: hypothetical protein IAA45_05525, partial [Candidatus Blautia gallistercoris]|nr:hypothetical protein [Candidatus Blautia gallistercoris]